MENEEEQLTRQLKIERIIDYVNQIEKSKRLHVLLIIKLYQEDLIKESSDGSRIDMNRLPDHVINNIYYYVIRSMAV